MLRPLQLQICGGLTRILSVLLLSVLCCSAAVAQQNVTVTGVVTNEAKQPIVGATVIQEGTSRGATTDSKGRFTLNISDRNATLQVSFIGMATQSVPVSGKTSLEIVLKEEAVSVGEVVVTALGIKREAKALGYAVSSVGKEDLTAGRESNIMQAMIGKVAGVAGALLGIKPVITLKQGEIFPSGIGRVRRKTMQKTVDLLLDYLRERGDDIGNYSIVIGYGYDRAEAESYRDMVMERLSVNYNIGGLPIYQIGATIGVHTGPYPLGLGILEKAIH